MTTFKLLTLRPVTVTHTVATSIFTTFRYGTSGPCSKGDTTLQCLRKIETLKAAKESVRDRLKRLAKQVRKKEEGDAVLCGAVWCCVVLCMMLCVVLCVVQY